MQSQLRHPAQRLLPILMCCGFLVTLWLGGGASRANALGQVLTRGAATIVLAFAVWRGDVDQLRVYRGPALVLGASALLVLLQLVPLPPGVWRALPARSLFEAAASVTGASQPWRPLAISPSGAVNAFFSLLVPAAALGVMTTLQPRARARVLPALLIFIFAEALVGLAQFSGAGIDNPLVNDTPGQVSGTLANRNHFALLLAIGCVLAPAWALAQREGLRWRSAGAFGLIMVFLLTILASGSRAGILVAAFALLAGVLLAAPEARRATRNAPRWVLPAAAAGAVMVIGLVILASVLAGRAESIHRATGVAVGSDMRGRALPAVLEMISDYFPFGSGFGSFDPVFRIHEPFGLLKFTYFNHAHNDFLETVLDGGLLGLAIMLAAIGWWAVLSARVWWPAATAGEAGRTDGRRGKLLLARVGSAGIFLVLVASVFDYPARIPVIMGVLVVAAVWLAEGARKRSSALPGDDQLL